MAKPKNRSSSKFRGETLSPQNIADIAKRKARVKAPIAAESITETIFIRLGNTVVPKKVERKPDLLPAEKSSETAVGVALEKAGLKSVPMTRTDQNAKPPKSAKPAPKEVHPGKTIVPIEPTPTVEALSKPKAKKSDMAAKDNKKKEKKKEQRKRNAEKKRHLAKLNRLFPDAAVTQSDKHHKEGRWQERKAEMLAFVARIELASLSELLAAWQERIAFVDYAQKTGRKVERLEASQAFITAIETEWARRGQPRDSVDDYFDWPTTNTGVDKGGMLGAIEWVELGMLKYLGYQVGDSSDLTEPARKAILRRAFSMNLPPIEGPKYMAKWGKPASSVRLKKMADSLASFTRSAKNRKSADMSTAIAERECDLRMLYDEFYVGKFRFDWPRV